MVYMRHREWMSTEYPSPPLASTRSRADSEASSPVAPVDRPVSLSREDNPSPPLDMVTQPGRQMGHCDPVASTAVLQVPLGSTAAGPSPSPPLEPAMMSSAPHKCGGSSGGDAPVASWGVRFDSGVPKDLQHEQRGQLEQLISAHPRAGASFEGSETASTRSVTGSTSPPLDEEEEEAGEEACCEQGGEEARGVELPSPKRTRPRAASSASNPVQQQQGCYYEL